MGALRSELVSPNTAPAQAELEQRDRPDMRRAALERVRAVAEDGRIASDGGALELGYQLFGVGEEIVNDLAQEAVILVEMLEALQTALIEHRRTVDPRPRRAGTIGAANA